MTMKHHSIPIEHRGLRFNAIIPSFKDSTIQRMSCIALIPSPCDSRFRYIAMDDCYYGHRMSEMIAAIVWNCKSETDQSWETTWLPADMMILDLVHNQIFSARDFMHNIEDVVSACYSMIWELNSMDSPQYLKSRILETITTHIPDVLMGGNLQDFDVDDVMVEFLEEDKITSWNLPMGYREYTPNSQKSPTYVKPKRLIKPPVKPVKEGLRPFEF